jgi:hypothetical protein
MSDPLDQLIADLEQVTHGTRAAFSGLSKAQLNWKSSAKSWSIAQCLDHLITINRLYFPLFEALRPGTVRPTLWERYSPFSGFLGRTLIRRLSPEYPRKMKTSPKAEPSASEIDEGIVDRFDRHQSELIRHLHEIPAGLDRKRTVVTSPLLRWVTYSLDDCLTILTVHEQRHFQQAKRVMETEGFPHRGRRVGGR